MAQKPSPENIGQPSVHRDVLADLITPNGGTYDWAACRNYPLLP